MRSHSRDLRWVLLLSRDGSLRGASRETARTFADDACSVFALQGTWDPARLVCDIRQVGDPAGTLYAGRVEWTPGGLTVGGQWHHARHPGGRFQCDEHSPLGVASIDRRPAGVWDGALVPVAARGAAAPAPPPSRPPMNVTRVEGLTVTCIRGHHREIFGAGFTEHSSYVIAGTAAIVPASGDWAVVRATVTGGGVSAALVGVARPDSGHLSSISGDPASLPPGRPNWTLTRTLGLAPPYRPSGPVRPPPGARQATQGSTGAEIPVDDSSDDLDDDAGADGVHVDTDSECDDDAHLAQHARAPRVAAQDDHGVGSSPYRARAAHVPLGSSVVAALRVTGVQAAASSPTT